MTIDDLMCNVGTVVVKVNVLLHRVGHDMATLLAFLFHCVFLSWIEFIYLNGPILYGIGFWNGRHFSDICSALSNVAASHWLDHESECLHLINRQVLSIAIVIYILLALAFVYFVSSHLWYKYTFVYPMLECRNGSISPAIWHSHPKIDRVRDD